MQSRIERCPLSARSSHWRTVKSISSCKYLHTIFVRSVYHYHPGQRARSVRNPRHRYGAMRGGLHLRSLSTVRRRLHEIVAKPLRSDHQRFLRRVLVFFLPAFLAKGHPRALSILSSSTLSSCAKKIVLSDIGRGK